MAELIQETKPHTIDYLIQSRYTHLYFCEGAWTDDPSRASVYDNETDAARVCVVHDLDGVDLVLRPSGTRTAILTTQLR